MTLETSLRSRSSDSTAAGAAVLRLRAAGCRRFGACGSKGESVRTRETSVSSTTTTTTKALGGLHRPGDGASSSAGRSSGRRDRRVAEIVRSGRDRWTACGPSQFAGIGRRRFDERVGRKGEAWLRAGLVSPRGRPRASPRRRVRSPRSGPRRAVVVANRGEPDRGDRRRPRRRPRAHPCSGRSRVERLREPTVVPGSAAQVVAAAPGRAVGACTGIRRPNRDGFDGSPRPIRRRGLFRRIGPNGLRASRRFGRFADRTEDLLKTGAIWSIALPLSTRTDDAEITRIHPDRTHDQRPGRGATTTRLVRRPGRISRRRCRRGASLVRRRTRRVADARSSPAFVDRVVSSRWKRDRERRSPR